MSAMFKAIKMKEDSGASTEDAKNAAKILAATFVDIKKDETFTAGMGGATVEGTWTFNKESGEGAPESWTAILNDDYARLSFYPAPPQIAAMLRESKEKGVMKGGVSLFKQ